MQGQLYFNFKHLISCTGGILHILGYNHCDSVSSTKFYSNINKYQKMKMNIYLI